jgi:hypothetical protein
LHSRRESNGTQTIKNSKQPTRSQFLPGADQDIGAPLSALVRGAGFPVDDFKELSRGLRDGERAAMRTTRRSRESAFSCDQELYGDSTF